jgi:hypothetical protein
MGGSESKSEKSMGNVVFVLPGHSQCPGHHRLGQTAPRGWGSIQRKSNLTQFVVFANERVREKIREKHRICRIGISWAFTTSRASTPGRTLPPGAGDPSKIRATYTYCRLCQWVEITWRSAGSLKTWVGFNIGHLQKS